MIYDLLPYSSPSLKTLLLSSLSSSSSLQQHFTGAAAAPQVHGTTAGSRGGMARRPKLPVLQLEITIHDSGRSSISVVVAYHHPWSSRPCTCACAAVAASFSVAKPVFAPCVQAWPQARWTNGRMGPAPLPVPVPLPAGVFLWSPVLFSELLPHVHCTFHCRYQKRYSHAAASDVRAPWASYFW